MTLCAIREAQAGRFTLTPTTANFATLPLTAQRQADTVYVDGGLKTSSPGLRQITPEPGGPYTPITALVSSSRIRLSSALRVRHYSAMPVLPLIWIAAMSSALPP